MGLPPLLAGGSQFTTISFGPDDTETDCGALGGLPTGGVGVVTGVDRSGGRELLSAKTNLVDSR